MNYELPFMLTQPPLAALATQIAHAAIRTPRSDKALLLNLSPYQKAINIDYLTAHTIQINRIPLQIL